MAKKKFRFDTDRIAIMFLTIVFAVVFRLLTHTWLRLDDFSVSAVVSPILGLLLAEVVKKHNIQVDADKLRARVEEIAKGYEKPEEVISWYYNNKRMLSEMESVVLEDQAVAQLMSELDIQDKDVSYQEAVKESQQREENE